VPSTRAAWPRSSSRRMRMPTAATPALHRARKPSTSVVGHADRLLYDPSPLAKALGEPQWSTASIYMPLYLVPMKMFAAQSSEVQGYNQIAEMERMPYRTLVLTDLESKRNFGLIFN
jgi:hypothetical protein